MSQASLSEQAAGLPARPGIYAFYDAHDCLLYVGKSVSLRARVRSYLREGGGHTRRTARLKDEAVRLEHVVCGSELEALLLEAREIKRRAPLYNVQGRYWRHYPFVKIEAGTFPRVDLTYELVEDGGRYFGPFPTETRAREALDALRPLMRWRSCAPLPKRACFEHTIGRCSAPCLGKVDAEAYEAQMEDLSAFLSGEAEPFLAGLEAEMLKASQELAFERARILRDRLGALRPLARRQAFLQAAKGELDCVIALPGAVAGTSLWLLVRRGRLVKSYPGVTSADAGKLARRLARALTKPAPSWGVRQDELDEINLLAGWLHRHAEDDQIVRLQPGLSVTEAVARGFAALTAPMAPRAVAERGAEWVIRPAR